MTPKLVILRCCRDWPIQTEAAYARGGTCGYCKKTPQIVLEPYRGPNGQQTR